MAGAATATSFQGFPPGGFEFFLELAAKQSREWFKENKARYEALWPKPLEALMVDLVAGLSDVFPEMGKARIHVFRIQRDTRFAADKSPYKNHIAAHVAVRPVDETTWGLTPSLYVHFGLEGSLVALGTWDLPKERLARFREAIASDRTGPRLQKLMDKLKAEGFGADSHGGMLKRVPPGYPQDHPRAELLKLKGLAVSASNVPEDLMGSRALLDWLADRIRTAAPVTAWLEEALA